MNWGMCGRRSREYDRQPREHHLQGQCCHLPPADKPYDNRWGCAVTYYSDDCIGNHHQYQAHWPAMISMTCNVLIAPDTVIVRGKSRRRERNGKYKLDLINVEAISVYFHCWDSRSFPCPTFQPVRNISFLVFKTKFFECRLEGAQTKRPQRTRGKIDWKQLNFEREDKRWWCRGARNVDVPFSQLHVIHLFRFFAASSCRNGRTLIRLLSWSRHSQ